MLLTVARRIRWVENQWSISWIDKIYFCEIALRNILKHRAYVNVFNNIQLTLSTSITIRVLLKVLSVKRGSLMMLMKAFISKLAAFSNLILLFFSFLQHSCIDFNAIFWTTHNRLAFYWHQRFLSQGAYLGVIVIDYPGSCMGPPHPRVYKQTTLAAPCVCLMTTPNQIAVAQAVQSLPALHRLSTQLNISVATLPQDSYISFKYFDKYSHNATQLVIC